MSLEEAAATLGTTAPDLMAAMIINELGKVPGAAAIITGVDGCATVKRAGDGEVQITLPAVLGQVLLIGLLSDPATRAAICSPLPAVAGSPEVQ